MKLWARLVCMATKHVPIWTTEARSKVEVLTLYRCKRCGKVSEVRYRTEQPISGRGGREPHRLTAGRKISGRPQTVTTGGSDGDRSKAVRWCGGVDGDTQAK